MSNVTSKTGSIQETCQSMQEAVVAATRAANSIPMTEFTYYNSFEGFSKVMQHEKRALISMLSELMKPHQVTKRAIEMISDVEDQFDALCDVNDVILDRVGHLLDDAAGLKKKNEDLIIATLNVNKSEHSVTTQKVASWNETTKKKQEGVYNLYTARGIERPQTTFKDKIDNRSSPFIPIIKNKPNSIKPLAILLEVNEAGEECYSHPYELEIEKFEPSGDMLGYLDTSIKPMDSTPLHMVTTPEQLAELVSNLKKCKEIAVDLEHHSYRTFQGFTCLMQISTAEEDFVLDALQLRSQLHLLNDVFTDPKIVKIFHGADMDILWLQRDFGLYVVNMFDTGQAAKVLNFAHFSLAYLLKHYCGFDVNKQFQLADWRMRPLPDDMIQYARQDTHYLLYIFNQMKKQLIANGNDSNNLLRCVFERSKQICLKRYEKPLTTQNGYMALVKRCKTALNARQSFALKELWMWRDRIARFEDESTGYVLPNHMLLQIAAVLPREQQGILACCNPVPPLVRQQLNELHAIILKAREVTLKKENSDEAVKSQTVEVRKPLDLDNYLYSKEDTSYLPEREGPLNTLLENGKGDEIDYEKFVHSNNRNGIGCVMQFFSTGQMASDSTLMSVMEEYISPYDRYKLAIKHRKKFEEEAACMREQMQKKAVEEVKAHFVSLALNIEEANEAGALKSIKQEVVEEEKSNVDPLPEDKPLRDLLPKKKKRKKPTPDIPCNPVASALYNLEQKASSSSEIVKMDSEPVVPQFDYKSFDYNKFSSNKVASKEYYDPDAQLRNALVKGDTKVKVKKKVGKSCTFGANRKRKN